MLASRMGYKAVEILLQEGNASKAIGIRRTNNCFDLEEALEVKRSYDKSIIELADILS